MRTMTFNLEGATEEQLRAAVLIYNEVPGSTSVYCADEEANIRLADLAMFQSTLHVVRDKRGRLTLGIQGVDANGRRRPLFVIPRKGLMIEVGVSKNPRPAGVHLPSTFGPPSSVSGRDEEADLEWATEFAMNSGVSVAAALRMKRRQR